MRRFINTKLGKALCNALALALFIPYVTMLTATRAVAQQVSLPSWAVLDFRNASGMGPANLGTVAADAIRTELEKTGKYEPVPKESIDRMYDTLNLQPPVIQKVSQMRLGQALQASTVLTGEIVNWRIVKDGAGRRADVILKLTVLDVASGTPVNGAALVASSSVRPPETAEDTLLADALATGASKAVSDITQKELPRATILNTRDDGTALINQGTRSGFKVGQEMIVVRGREQVATAVVSEVDADSAYIKLAQSFKGIQPGDKVRAIFTPPDIETKFSSHNDVIVKKSKPRSPNSGLLTVLAVVGLVAFIISSAPNDQSLVSVVRAQPVTLFTGKGAVEVSWSPDMFTKGFDRRVEWQIWRSDILATPVEVVPGSQIVFVDDSNARAFTYGNITGIPGGFTCDNTSEPTATIDPASPVPGVQSGIPYLYKVMLIYRIPGAELPTPTQDSWCYFKSDFTAAVGYATPYDSVGLISPADNTNITGPVSFSFTASGNPLAPAVTLEYVVQISPVSTFPKNNSLVVATFQNTAVGGSLAAGPIDLSGVFPAAGAIYWRVGVRNIADKPGPKPDPASGLRYVFSVPRVLLR